MAVKIQSNSCDRSPPKHYVAKASAAMRESCDALQEACRTSLCDEGDTGYIHIFTPLPEGWEEHTSRKDGATYFYNTVTEETTWDRPVTKEARTQAKDCRCVCQQDCQRKFLREKQQEVDLMALFAGSRHIVQVDS